MEEFPLQRDQRHPPQSEQMYQHSPSQAVERRMRRAGLEQKKIELTKLIQTLSGELQTLPAEIDQITRQLSHLSGSKQAAEMQRLEKIKALYEEKQKELQNASAERKTIMRELQAAPFAGADLETLKALERAKIDEELKTAKGPKRQKLKRLEGKIEKSEVICCLPPKAVLNSNPLDRLNGLEVDEEGAWKRPPERKSRKRLREEAGVETQASQSAVQDREAREVRSEQSVEPIEIEDDQPAVPSGFDESELLDPMNVDEVVLAPLQVQSESAILSEQIDAEQKELQSPAVFSSLSEQIDAAQKEFRSPAVLSSLSEQIDAEQKELQSPAVFSSLSEQIDAEPKESQSPVVLSSLSEQIDAAQKEFRSPAALSSLIACEEKSYTSRRSKRQRITEGLVREVVEEIEQEESMKVAEILCALPASSNPEYSILSELEGTVVPVSESTSNLRTASEADCAAPLTSGVVLDVNSAIDIKVSSPQPSPTSSPSPLPSSSPQSSEAKEQSVQRISGNHQELLRHICDMHELYQKYKAIENDPMQSQQRQAITDLRTNKAGIIFEYYKTFLQKLIEEKCANARRKKKRIYAICDHFSDETLNALFRAIKGDDADQAIHSYLKSIIIPLIEAKNHGTFETGIDCMLAVICKEDEALCEEEAHLRGDAFSSERERGYLDRIMGAQESKKGITGKEVRQKLLTTFSSNKNKVLYESGGKKTTVGDIIRQTMDGDAEYLKYIKEPSVRGKRLLENRFTDEAVEHYLKYLGQTERRSKRIAAQKASISSKKASPQSVSDKLPNLELSHDLLTLISLYFGYRPIHALTMAHSFNNGGFLVSHNVYPVDFIFEKPPLYLIHTGTAGPMKAGSGHFFAGRLVEHVSLIPDMPDIEGASPKIDPTEGASPKIDQTEEASPMHHASLMDVDGELKAETAIDGDDKEVEEVREVGDDKDLQGENTTGIPAILFGNAKAPTCRGLSAASKSESREQVAGRKAQIGTCRDFRAGIAENTTAIADSQEDPSGSEISAEDSDRPGISAAEMQAACMPDPDDMSPSPFAILDQGQSQSQPIMGEERFGFDYSMSTERYRSDRDAQDALESEIFAQMRAAASEISAFRLQLPRFMLEQMIDMRLMQHRFRLAPDVFERLRADALAEL